MTTATGTDDLRLLAAAQAGNPHALAELATAYLPLVYAIVRRGLGRLPDVDDVVQETMLRVLRELRALRTPESFRPWLMTITTRQVSTFRRRWQTAAERTVALDDVVDEPATATEEVTLLRLELSGQLRQVARATRWLDPHDLAPLSLWWLESAGRLTRTELASALGKSVAHAGVCMQRIRARLESSRSVVAALDAVPRCAVLAETLEGWVGSPSPLWRKRILRHVRSCPPCRHASTRLLPPEILFEGLVLLFGTDPIAEICYVEGRPQSRLRCEPHSAKDGKYIDGGLLNVSNRSGNVQYIDG